MKCFWCHRLCEDGKIAEKSMLPGEYVYGGDSMCGFHWTPSAAGVRRL